MCCCLGFEEDTEAAASRNAVMFATGRDRHSSAVAMWQHSNWRHRNCSGVCCEFCAKLPAYFFLRLCVLFISRLHACVWLEQSQSLESLEDFKRKLANEHTTVSAKLDQVVFLLMCFSCCLGPAAAHT